MLMPLLSCTRRLSGPESTPGEVIEYLSEKDRELLRQLTSDMAMDVREEDVKLLVEPVPEWKKHAYRR